MKTQSQIRISALSLLVVLCLTLATLPASAQVLYDNGPVNGNAECLANQWRRRRQRQLPSLGRSINDGFDFYVWDIPRRQH